MASVVVNGDTSGAVTLSAPAVAGTVTVTLPSTSGTMAVLPTATGVLAESAGGTGTTTGYYGFKNRLINSAMVIDQRNAGASVTPTSSAYTLDRWSLVITQASKLSVQQNAGSVTPPVGFKNYLGATSLSAYSVSASDYFLLYQGIEGFNVADLQWGTANARTVTLSFQVYSSLTGTFGGSLVNADFNRSYPFTYTVSSANTWTNISVTIAGDTSGTWATDNTQGIRLYFGLGVGSTNSGTAGAWAGAQYLSATGATSVVGTNGATFYITGVQLEKGSTATSFDYRPYGTEEALAQRYCQVVEQNNFGIILSSANSGTTWTWWPLKTTMRASPSLTLQNSGAWVGTTPTIYAQPNIVGFTGGTTNFYLGGGSGGSAIAVLASEL